MNGIHDMGGMEGFGPVEPEPNEPPFHTKWEGRALALNRAMSYAKVWNIDKSRAAIEEMAPRDYLTMTYYEKWAMRLEKLLLEYGLVGADEIAAGHSLRQGKALPRTLAAAEVAKSLSRGSYGRPTNSTPRFAEGDRVRTRKHSPEDPHPVAALRARQNRRDRMRARLPRIPGFDRDRRRREPAVALHRALRGPRAVGRARRRDAESVDRGVGAVSGPGVT